jgi:heptose-I-phosphate ethanolaminephosphotransferase
LSLAFNVIFFSAYIGLARLLPLSVGRAMVSMTFVVFAMFTVLNVLHFHMYGQLAGLPLFYAALDTTWPEASEFSRMAMMNIGAVPFLMAGLAAMPLALGPIRFRSIPRVALRPGARCGVGALGLSILIGLWQFGLTKPYVWQNNPVMMIPGTIAEAVLETREIKNALELSAGNAPSGVAATDSKPATHILIIGESTTRRHMSIYGYGRETSPELTKLAPELDIATDACSSRSTTPEQLKELLTFATREDPTPLLAAPTLVQLMKAGGFRTYWLTNQQLAGEYDRWAGIFSKPADERYLINMRGPDEGISYDGNLLPYLKQVLLDGSDARRFIIVHLLGTHHSYDLRYPSEFQKFNDLAGADERFLAKDHNAWNAWIYNTYDNAVLYNDFIVSEIIKEAKKLDRATVTFLSDHGESLGEEAQYFGHFSEAGPRQVFEVPLLFYLSAGFKADHGEKHARLRSNLGQAIQSDQLIHTFLDLYGIDYPLFRAEQSLLRASFQPKLRYCDTFVSGRGLAKLIPDARSAMGP